MIWECTLASSAAILHFMVPSPFTSRKVFDLIRFTLALNAGWFGGKMNSFMQLVMHRDAQLSTWIVKQSELKRHWRASADSLVSSAA
jgi:hypothetical protein